MEDIIDFLKTDTKLLKDRNKPDKQTDKTKITQDEAGKIFKRKKRKIS